MRMQGEKYVDKYITDALFEFMKEKPYHDITITEVIARAGVVKMSFYRNYRSKEEVIRQWIRKVTDEFLDTSGLSFSKDAREDYFLKLFMHLYKYRERTSLIYQAGLAYLLKDEFEERFFTEEREKYNTYEIYFIAGGVFNVYYYWLMNGHQESPAELTGKLLKLL